MNRPWGNFFILYEDDHCKVKKIVVKCQQSISYQSHKKRSEHWIIVSGKGTLTLDDKAREVSYGDYIFIDKNQKHKIRCSSEEDLVFIETQIGSYFGEDDIIRYSDMYGRN